MKNLVFLFDEVDKVGVLVQGDFVVVLFEVFDLVQNYVFIDYYMGVFFDFSDVFFIVIVNFVQNILQFFFDCMEIVEFLGYIECEKVEIVECYLVFCQIVEGGMLLDELMIESDVICSVVLGYICEVGVCQFECEFGCFVCKVVCK